MKCSYCQEEIIRNLSFKEILFPFLLKNERCVYCQNLFERIVSPNCPTCSKPGWTLSCEECQQWKEQYPHYDFCHQALFSYNEAFKEWIYQYKFLGDFRLKTTFTVELQEYFSHKKDWIICSIPLSKERFSQRGFNQVEAFLQAANITTSPLLKKATDSLPQSNKNRQERLASPQVFGPTDQTYKIRNKKVILVDDVYTTGRTLFHAAEILQMYQPEKIQTFSLAR